MSKRTIKNGHVISTFPSNGGYCTSVYGKYGETLKIIYSSTYPEANRNHLRMLSIL